MVAASLLQAPLSWPGESLKDELPWCKFSGITWLPDSSGLFYARYDKPASLDSVAGKSAGTEVEAAKGQKVTTGHACMWWHCHPRSPPPTHALLQLVFHSLGSSAEDDVVVYEDPVHPNWRFDSTVSTDGTVLLLTAHEGCDPVETLYYVNLTPGAAATSFQVIKLIDNMGMAKGVMVPTHSMPPPHPLLFLHVIHRRWLHLPGQRRPSLLLHDQPQRASLPRSLH